MSCLFLQKSLNLASGSIIFSSDKLIEPLTENIWPTLQGLAATKIYKPYALNMSKSQSTSYHFKVKSSKIKASGTLVQSILHPAMESFDTVC